MRIVYFLPFKIWRAVRLIVDTGLHYTGMKRDEAIKMFADNAWDDSDFTRKEVRECYRSDRSNKRLSYQLHGETGSSTVVQIW